MYICIIIGIIVLAGLILLVITVTARPFLLGPFASRHRCDYIPNRPDHKITGNVRYFGDDRAPYFAMANDQPNPKITGEILRYTESPYFAMANSQPDPKITGEILNYTEHPLSSMDRKTASHYGLSHPSKAYGKQAASAIGRTGEFPGQRKAFGIAKRMGAGLKPPFRCQCTGIGPDNVSCGNRAVLGNINDERTGLDYVTVMKSYGPDRTGNRKTGWTCFDSEGILAVPSASAAPLAATVAVEETEAEIADTGPS